MVAKVYVVMKDCDYEGDEIYDGKFYLSKEYAEKIADSLIRKDSSGRILDYFFVNELELGE